MTKGHQFLLADGVTITGETNYEFGGDDIAELALYCAATLGGTTPTFDAKLQYKDALGNWQDCASGAITQQTATFTDANVEDVTDGPDTGATRFRVNVTVNTADGDETYTDVSVGVSIRRN